MLKVEHRLVVHENQAIRQLRNELGLSRSCFLHVTLVPYINAAQELKTKPTQHSVKELQGMGIQPDILLCRSEMKIPVDQKSKIALFCNIKIDNVIEALDVKSIYEVPIKYHESNLDVQLLNHFNLSPSKKANLNVWKQIVKTQESSEGTVTIGVVGKYTSIIDSYKSLIEALNHGGIANKTNVDIKWIDAEEFDEKLFENNIVKDLNGILVPGGFGKRGSAGKINAIKYAREFKVPFFGICLGMQMAVIEFARNVMNFKEASSTEFEKTSMPVVSLLTEWVSKDGLVQRDSKSDYGGTMRLGSYECHLTNKSKIKNIYERDIVFERHRHRYEVNKNLCEGFEEKGMFFTGLSPNKELPEILELIDHPWFFGVQFHPELKSKPFDPHPLFSSFVRASLEKSRLI